MYATMVPPKNDNWIRRFIVSDPKRHKKGFTIYKVTSIVSITVHSLYVIKPMLQTSENIFYYEFKNYSFAVVTTRYDLYLFCVVFTNQICRHPTS
jgi:hypothetical protein